jgi:hypothetical protein
VDEIINEVLEFYFWNPLLNKNVLWL